MIQIMAQLVDSPRAMDGLRGVGEADTRSAGREKPSPHKRRRSVSEETEAQHRCQACSGMHIPSGENLLNHLA